MAASTHVKSIRHILVKVHAAPKARVHKMATRRTLHLAQQKTPIVHWKMARAPKTAHHSTQRRR